MTTVFGDVEEAVRMGANAVSIGAFMLGDFQAEQIRDIGNDFQGVHELWHCR
jgi:DhnA family fructose-bisphosphate aldolase class Ia